MQIIQECTFTATLKPPLPIGAGPIGPRMYYDANPRLETGDARYAWVNRTFFVGEGRLLPGLGVEYRVWRPA
jgi:hypothetical protein